MSKLLFEFYGSNVLKTRYKDGWWNNIQVYYLDADEEWKILWRSSLCSSTERNEKEKNWERKKEKSGERKKCVGMADWIFYSLGHSSLLLSSRRFGIYPYGLSSVHPDYNWNLTLYGLYHHGSYCRLSSVFKLSIPWEKFWLLIWTAYKNTSLSLFYITSYIILY